MVFGIRPRCIPYTNYNWTTVAICFRWYHVWPFWHIFNVESWVWENVDTTQSWSHIYKWVRMGGVEKVTFSRERGFESMHQLFINSVGLTTLMKCIYRDCRCWMGAWGIDGEREERRDFSLTDNNLHMDSVYKCQLSMIKYRMYAC